MVTGKQYADKCMEVMKLKPAAGYIYGASAKGLVWTAAKQQALVDKYNRTKKSELELSAKYGSKWIGHVVYDCSGLTSGKASELGLNYHHGSNSSWKYDCQAKGKITSGIKLPVGAWVYTGTENSHGHIGIYVGNGKTLEAQGTKAGVVLSDLSLKKWTYWGLGKGMTFDFIPGVDPVPEPEPAPTPTPEPTPAPSPTPSKKYPTVKKGSKGAAVKTLQELLNQNGSKLSVDGIFGSKTESAVKAYQKKKKLAVDGIVGPKTWAALTA